MVDFFLDILLIFVICLIVIPVFSSLFNKKRFYANHNKLNYPFFIGFLGITCIVLVCCLTYIYFFVPSAKSSEEDIYYFVGITVVFTLIGLFSLGEYFITKGEFSQTGIQFKTFLRGKLSSNWADLESVTFNEMASWYSLVFKDGTKIRLSSWLYGHVAVLKHIESLGFEIKD